MKREMYQRVFEVAFWGLEDTSAPSLFGTPPLYLWALDLLALGPYAQWPEPEDIALAVSADEEAGAPLTEVGRLVASVACASSPEKALEFAQRLMGSSEPNAVLEVLYARSKDRVRIALASGSIYDQYDKLAELDSLTAARLLRQRIRTLRAGERSVYNIEAWRALLEQVRSKSDAPLLEEWYAERLLDVVDRRGQGGEFGADLIRSLLEITDGPRDGA